MGVEMYSKENNSSDAAMHIPKILPLPKNGKMRKYLEYIRSEISVFRITVIFKRV